MEVDAKRGRKSEGAASVDPESSPEASELAIIPDSDSDSDFSG